MPKIEINDVDDVIFNPKRYFNNPLEVVDNDFLFTDQKIALLFNWERDVQQESVAEEENMQGNIPSVLPEIKAALIKLGVTIDIEQMSGGKFGGL